MIPMSSAPRPEGAANSSERDLFIGMATGVNESSQVFQNVQPMYRESGHANVSFEFAQENEMRGVYPSPVGTPVALSYNGGVDLQHWQTSAMQFSQVPTSPAHPPRRVATCLNKRPRQQSYGPTCGAGSSSTSRRPCRSTGS